MIREVKVNYAIGCIYDEDKEIILFPGLSTVWSNEEFDLKKEFNWISKGIDRCFPSDVIGNILINLMRVEYAWNRKQNALKPFVISVIYTDNGEEVMGAKDKLNSMLQSFEYFKERGYSILTINAALNDLDNNDYQREFDLYTAVAYVFEKSKKIVYYPVSVLNNVSGLRNLNIILSEIKNNNDLEKCKEINCNFERKIKNIEKEYGEKSNIMIRLVLGAIDRQTNDNISSVLKYCHRNLGASKFLENGYEFLDGLQIE